MKLKVCAFVIAAMLAGACNTTPPADSPPAPSTIASTPASAPASTPTPTPSSSASSTPPKSMNMNMKPREPVAYTRGPAVTPAKDLTAWLDKQITAKGEPRLVRLPVIVKTSSNAPGFTGAGARVGSATDALTIDVNDSMLGVSLNDRARSACPKQTTCALWLEGYWRGKSASGAFAFDVKYVGDAITPESLASANYAEVAEVDVGAKKP